jgi:hypothetical protein
VNITPAASWGICLEINSASQALGDMTSAVSCFSYKQHAFNHACLVVTIHGIPAYIISFSTPFCKKMAHPALQSIAVVSLTHANPLAGEQTLKWRKSLRNHNTYV